MKKTYKLLAVALLLAGIHQTAKSQLTIIGYGALGYASGVSNNGVVSIYTTAGAAYKWDSVNGQVQIGAVTNGYPGAGQAHISKDGSLISYTMTNPNNNFNELSLYNVQSGTWQHLGGLVASGWDGSISSAWNMSKDGSTIVGLGWLTAGMAHAIKWDVTTGVVDLGSIETGRSSRANATSANKQVIVGWQDEPDGTRRGAKWVNGVEEYILDNNGNKVGEAGDVSDDGNTIIVAGLPNPKIWKLGTGMIEITHPNSAPSFRGGATAISGDGKKVVGFFRPFPGPPTMGEGFIWTQESGRVNLNTYATNLGIDTQGVTMSLPLAISQDGTKIVGSGMGPTGAVTWILDLTNYLGVNQVKTNESVSVYPNPVKDLLNINAKNISHVEIYNAAGQKIQAPTESKNQLDVSTLPKGVYVIKVTSNNSTQSTKFIKE